METLASSFKYKNVGHLEFAQIDSDKTYLWVFNADKTPPHIGISSKGKYFSLKSGGIDDGIGIDSIVSLIKQKSIPTLLIELAIPKLPEINSFFDQYQSTVAYETTCLEPIKKILGSGNEDTIHDLLSTLLGRDQVVAVLGKHLPNDYAGIPFYTLEDIHVYLSNKKA